MGIKIGERAITMTDDYKLIIEREHQTVMAHYEVSLRVLYHELRISADSA